MATLHPTAEIARGARLGEGVTVGAYSVVGPDVVLGDGVSLGPHAVVTGRTRLGAGVVVGSFAVLGGPPQDRGHEGAPGELVVGDRVVVREHVTAHAGSSGGRMRTEIGADCMLMVGSHVAHDCVVGAGCTLVNGAMLGGHVSLGPGVFVGGGSTVHQFVRLGRMAHVGGSSAVERDVVPWGLAMGNRASLRGPNIVGMQRAGLDKAALRGAQRLWRDLFGEGDGTLRERVTAAQARGDYGPVGDDVLAFLAEPSRRGVLTP